MIVSRTGGANRSPATLRRPASFVSEVLESRLLLHAGDADSGFGNNGVVFPADVNFSADTSAGATVFTGDGKLIVAGAISDPALRMPHTSTGLCVARYNADGTLDRTFDGDGISVLDTPEATEATPEITETPEGTPEVTETPPVSSTETVEPPATETVAPPPATETVAPPTETATTAPPPVIQPTEEATQSL